MFGVIRLLILLLGFSVWSQTADAGVRSFFSPSVLGDRIAFCTSNAKLCGKPIADAWCAHQGFEKAILFQRSTPKSSIVRYSDNGKICKSGNCVAFRQIKCLSSTPPKA